MHGIFPPRLPIVEHWAEVDHHRRGSNNSFLNMRQREIKRHKTREYRRQLRWADGIAIAIQHWT